MRRTILFFLAKTKPRWSLNVRWSVISKLFPFPSKYAWIASMPRFTACVQPSSHIIVQILSTMWVWEPGISWLLWSCSMVLFCCPMLYCFFRLHLVMPWEESILPKCKIKTTCKWRKDSLENPDDGRADIWSQWSSYSGMDDKKPIMKSHESIHIVGFIDTHQIPYPPDVGWIP